MLYVCGNCSNYTYDGDNRKGYCAYYRSYYYPTESACSSFDEGTENVWRSGTDCFLTTACCEWKGLPDDCAELTDLRNFRDEFLLKTAEGRVLVEEYYRIAPGIVVRLKTSPECDRWMQYIYNEIQSVRTLIHTGRSEEAVEAYRQMVLTLQTAL